MAHYKYKVVADEIARSVEHEAAANPYFDDDFEHDLQQLARAYPNVSELFVFKADKPNEKLADTSALIYDVSGYFDPKKRKSISLLLPGLIEKAKGEYIVKSEFKYGEMREERAVILVLFNTIDVVLNNFYVSLYILGTVLVFGWVLFYIIGRARINTMLAPIEAISNVAKRINGENLALRIDESQTQFELYELARTVNTMMDRIQSSYNKQMRFVSDVSHELRTPVSVVSGYGNMLKRWGKEDEEILKEAIDAIINETNAMNDLIEKLLFLARHDNESLKFEFELTDLGKIIREVIKETKLVHAEFRFEESIAPNIIAEADPARIKQLTRILIDNALKYSSSIRTISVKMNIEDSYAVLSIRDFGIGISSDDLPNIFDRFYRTDDSRTKATGGYGLGLPMASIIASGHEGSITVRSKLDYGSEFIVKLPVSQHSIIRAADSEAAMAPTP
ncbi:MAG: HAMP domain-containing histidine kinase [Eubacteriaceae bacterium]|nr:HAMP domain-containing histidine kinase [Eubacteriaceae bacterium]